NPVIEPSPWTDSGVEQAHIGLQRSKQLLDAINRELERDEIELKRRIRSKIAKEQSAKNPAPDKVAADKVAADKVAADKIAADKIAADKIAADKIAA
ncbi:hypothetical protein SB749_19150, partial [Brevibacterium sp. SIMBA_078]